MNSSIAHRPATRRLAVAGGFAALGLAAAACGGPATGYGGSAPAQAPAAATGGAAAAGGYYGGMPAPAPGAGAGTAAPATVAGHPTSLGTVLTDQAGRTLYLFGKDAGTTSACTGACAQAWPPLLTGAAPAAGDGATAALVGTSRRADGTMQVTYAGHPLYTFTGDTTPGQTRGEGLTAFGAAWHVLTPQGGMIGHG